MLYILLIQYNPVRLNSLGFSSHYTTAWNPRYNFYPDLYLKKNWTWEGIIVTHQSTKEENCWNMLLCWPSLDHKHRGAEEPSENTNLQYHPSQMNLFLRKIYGDQKCNHWQIWKNPISFYLKTYNIYIKHQCWTAQVTITARRWSRKKNKTKELSVLWIDSR